MSALGRRRGARARDRLLLSHLLVCLGGLIVGLLVMQLQWVHQSSSLQQQQQTPTTAMSMTLSLSSTTDDRPEPEPNLSPRRPKQVYTVRSTPSPTPSPTASPTRPFRERLRSQTTSYQCQHPHGELLQTPALVMIGAQKAGTSALASMLAMHPQLVGQRKEPHYFDYRYKDAAEQARTDLAKAGVNASQLDCFLHAAYLRHTLLAEQVIERIRTGNTTLPLHAFEKSPSYIMYPTAVGGIRHTLPWTKILVLLRNPVERFLSHHRMQVRLGVRRPRVLVPVLNLELDSLFKSQFVNLKQFFRGNYSDPDHDNLFAIPAQALDKAYRDRFESDTRTVLWLKAREHEHGLRRGMYAMQLERWMREFSVHALGVDQLPAKAGSMLVLPYELFQAHPGPVLAYVFGFLGVEAMNLDEDMLRTEYRSAREDKTLEVQSLVRTGQDVNEPDARAFLERFYQPYNEKLVELLGEDWQGIWNSNATEWMARWLDKLK